MDIIALKLTNGDEIIAESISPTSSKITIRRPLALRAQMTPEGPTLGFFPWAIMLQDSEEINIDKRHVICSYMPTDDVANNYIKSVTGIELVAPSSKILYS